MKIIQMLFSIAIFVSLTQATELRLPDGNHVIFNTSMGREIVSLTMSSIGKKDTQFAIESRLFSENKQKFQIIHGEKSVIIQPMFREQQMFFNTYDGIQYWLSTKHLVNITENPDTNFVGLRLLDGPSTYQYILVLFPHPFSFLPLGSLYRCGEVLVAIINEQNKIDMTVLSNRKDKSWEIEDSSYQWKFKKQVNKYIFGRSTYKNTQKPVTIKLGNGEYCQIVFSELEKANNNGLQGSGYLSFKDVLENSTVLKSKKIEKVEEL